MQRFDMPEINPSALLASFLVDLGKMFSRCQGLTINPLKFIIFIFSVLNPSLTRICITPDS